MDTKILQRIGLTDSEIKVYFALLKLGPSSTGPIISEAKINHSKIYLILEKLQAKGLVSFVIQSNTKFYQAADPKSFLDFVKKKKSEIEEQERQIEELIPKLQLQQKLAADTQQATVFTGYKGMKSAFSQLLESLGVDEEYFVFSLYEEASSKQLQRFFLNYHQKRIEKKIKVKILTMKKFKKPTKQKFPEYKYSQRRYIDLELPTGLFIFNNVVMHVIWSDNPTLFLIQSEQNAKRYKKFFLDLWKTATS